MPADFRSFEQRLNALERKGNIHDVDIERLWKLQRPQGEGVPVGGPWPPIDFTGPWDEEPPCTDCETECFRIEASGFAGDLEQFNGTRCFTRSSDCGWVTSSADVPLLRYMSLQMNESAEPPVVILSLQGQTVSYRTNEMDCSISRTLTATPAPDEMTPLWPATLELVPVTCGDCTPSTGTGTDTGTGTGTTTSTGTTATCPPMTSTAWEWTGAFPWVVGSGGMCSGQDGCEACPPDYPGEYPGQIVVTPCGPAPADCSSSTGTATGTATGTTTGTGTTPPTEGTNTGDPSSTGTGTTPPTGTGTGTSGGTGTTAPTGTGTTSGTGTAAPGTCSYTLAAAAWCVVGGVTHSLYNLATSCSVSGGGSCPAQLVVPGTAPTLTVPCGTTASYPCEGGGTEAGTEEGPPEEP
ncbi:hypothetical protein [Planctopirus hydrillae]|uniref:Uncharacterized protein n=1 Tax=Planctopirus hydrillae TaxID=1841610 RepID=A0A1C3E4A4_9PLAN|nr:hypothetical protein [Planctopirus hydrillae]ODA28081.1 hypothetical protein A6X21_14565 [Planctopirus hydrillae]